MAALLVGDLPLSPVWVTVYRARRGDEDLAVTIFSGKVVRARFEESEAILTGASLMAKLAGTVPVLAIQAPCNYVLYSAACGANPTGPGIVIQTIMGRGGSTESGLDPSSVHNPLSANMDETRTPREFSVEGE